MDADLKFEEENITFSNKRLRDRRRYDVIIVVGNAAGSSTSDTNIST